MRYAQSREKAVSILLACALPALLSCADNGRIVDPTVPGVSVVAVAVDSASLAVGSVARAVATPIDAEGNVLTGHAVSWASLAPAVASVSASGIVTALAAGSADIQGTVSGMAGLATLTIVVPPSAVVPPSPDSSAQPDILNHDFNDGTLGGFIDPWKERVDFPDDPTGSGRGKVARLAYAPAPVSGHSSHEVGFGYETGADRVRYGRTIWTRAQIYMPYSGSTVNANHNRKLFYFLGTSVTGSHSGVILHRRDMMLYLSSMDWMNGSLEETLSESTGIRLADDTWHTIEVRMTTNSADNIRDGIIEVYMNDEATPSYSRRTGLGWITEKYSGGTFFDWFGLGYQLTTDANDPVYSEYRYWDNVAMSTTRIGR